MKLNKVALLSGLGLFLCTGALAHNMLCTDYVDAEDIYLPAGQVGCGIMCNGSMVGPLGYCPSGTSCCGYSTCANPQKDLVLACCPAGTTCTTNSNTGGVPKCN